ncbi:Cilia- and flagella-associated protein 57 [Bagarius yarrelli]|uniref:Cilia-and flagella-associated protein 57 n=1 Tax=Bagarius yarrelli TaxID=175774 RepID=A0A556TZS8_BAGYA|nr:Cilia- and flagella-associated protein 57 [Bagarius yarrelli]
MAEVEISPHHVFGLRAGVKNNLFFLDDQTVLFPVGTNCARYNLHQRCYKIIPVSERNRSMQALAISPNWRYLAVSERSDRGSITIYDLHQEQSRKRKVLTGGDVKVQEFVSMAFSPDSKYLLGQGEGPTWTLIYWQWEMNRIMAVVKSTNTGPVYQVSFNPQDSTQVCVSGHSVLKLFRYVDGSLKQTNSAKLEGQNVLSHAWTSEERIIAGTETGRLLVFESGDLRWDMSVANKITEHERQSQIEDGTQPVPTAMPRVTVIKAYSKGFACSAGPGTACLFEKTEEKDSYRQIREIRIPLDQCSNETGQAEQQEITSMCISPSEEALAVSTDRGQIFVIALSSAEISKGMQAYFEFLLHPFHSGSITGLSACIRKPLIATCSTDRSIRIWNYDTGALDLYKEFQEELFSVALHPSGLFLLAGFSDKLHLMNLLVDDIRTFRMFTVRNCRECVFSHGGHMFAAVNGNVIHLYSTVTFDNILNLKGHSGKVRSVVWNADDSRLVSCGMDGAVYEWNTLRGQRESESVLKSCSYTNIALSHDTKTIIAVLREVASDGVIYTAVVLTRSGRTLLIGTSGGTIRSIKYPLPVQKDWNEYQAHSGPINKMVITFDDRFLISASEDSCLFVWKITEQEGRGAKKDRELSYAEEILITRSDLEEKNQIMLELKTRVEELKMENEYQLRLKEMIYNEKIKELTEKFIQQIEMLTKHNQVRDSGFIMSNFSPDLDKSTNNQKLMLEYEKHQELQLKLRWMQDNYEEKLQDLEGVRVRALEDMSEFYEAKLKEKALELAQCQDEFQQQLREWEEINKQTEEDGDLELNDIRVKYERKLWEEKEANLKLNGETRVMKKKFISLQREIDNRNLDIEKLKVELQKQHGVIKALEKDIIGLRREIQERDETIQDKENRIYELKKKNEELEKFKFVLDFKVSELKKQIEPRENEVKEMKERVHQMEAELEQFRKKGIQLELIISELKQKLKAVEKERQRETQRVRDVDAELHRLKTELHNCVGFIQEPRKLKETIREIYLHYVHRSDVVEVARADADVQREYSRQREHMERNMDSLRSKLAKDIKAHEEKNRKLMKENVSLITEINDLRRDLRLMRAQIYNYETQSGLNRNKSRSATYIKQVASPTASQLNLEGEAEHIIQQQRLEIQRLRKEIQAQGQRQGQEQSFVLPGSIKFPALTT